jgi:hypothetical protein
VKNKKQQKLPRGLRWDPKSPYIFFSWRDERRKLHQKSTEKTDPAEALLFKIRFLGRSSWMLGWPALGSPSALAVRLGALSLAGFRSTT